MNKGKGRRQLDFTRRDFLKGAGAVASGSLVLGEDIYCLTRPDDELQESTKLTGYTDRPSVQPGETIRFMVSSEESQYQMDIVRLIHGDPNPRGPGFKEEIIKTAVNGTYPGRKQQLHYGSYVIVPDGELLQFTGSFTLQTWIYPTTSRKGVQGILTKWSSVEESGYGLFIEDDGHLALWMGDGNGRVHQVRTDKPLRDREWYFIAASCDADTGRVVLYQEPLERWPVEDTRSVVTQTTLLRSVGRNKSPFLVAAYLGSAGAGKDVVVGHFNGKVDSPRLFRRALSTEEMTEINLGDRRQDLKKDLVAAWDFSLDISTRTVSDVSPNRLHGRTVNMPMRAATGHNWKEREPDFKGAPAEYGAIHFHDDDMDDAGWQVDFEFRIPDSFKTGIYAARIRARGLEDHIPFFVRPKKGTTSARIAFLVPTFNYLAYSHFGSKLPGLISLYERHSDGSGVCYASRLRPLMTMRPKAATWFITSGRVYPRHLSADLYFVDWLEAKGFQYDIITDEDLHSEGEQLLAPYRVVVTGSHPEYYSEAMLDAVAGYTGNGGRLMYMGGNGFYWVTSVDPEQPHMIEVRRWAGTEAWEAEPGEYYHSTTGELGGLWRKRGRAPQELVGVGFTAMGWLGGRCGPGRPYIRQPGSFDPRAAFIFEGIGKDERIGDFNGLGLQDGVAGDEIDRFDLRLGSPNHALMLATASGYLYFYLPVLEDLLESRPWKDPEPQARTDMVYFECPKGGAVFSVGAVSWFGGLSYNGYKNTVSQVTENVLRRFALDAPLPDAAS